MKEWQSQAHVKWECKYHVVIVSKYRKKTNFKKFRKQIGAILRELCCQKARFSGANFGLVAIVSAPLEWMKLLSVIIFKIRKSMIRA